jgi:N-formylglutamate amidohydrolase
MTDAFTDELFAPTSFEAARVVFPVSRMVCDVERFPDGADEPMALRGMGAVYVKTTDGRPLRQHLTAGPGSSRPGIAPIIRSSQSRWSS